MIIRRRHTANYTTIGNTLFEDRRLAADEVGVLAWLLSRPNDWEVRRAAIARRWGMGREKIARIFHSFIRTGWVVAESTRLSDGRFFVAYVVNDEPGPELSPEEAKNAVSLIPAEPGDEADEAGSETEETENSSTKTVPENPYAVPPVAGKPDTANPARLYIDSLKPESQTPTRPPAPVGPPFVDLRTIWPEDHVNSAFACEKRFARATCASFLWTCRR